MTLALITIKQCFELFIVIVLTEFLDADISEFSSFMSKDLNTLLPVHELSKQSYEHLFAIQQHAIHFLNSTLTLGRFFSLNMDKA